MPGSRWSDGYATRRIGGPSSPMSHLTHQGRGAGAQARRIAKKAWTSRVGRMEHRVWTLSRTAV